VVGVPERRYSLDQAAASLAEARGGGDPCAGCGHR